MGTNIGDKPQLLTVGQMAEINQVSPQTLRYYDKIGLLKPAAIYDNGYRYYEISQCALLDMIAHMKALGFSLDEIRDFIRTGDQTAYIAELGAMRKQLSKDISQMQNRLHIINRKLSDYYRYSNLPAPGVPYLEVMPRRRILAFDTNINYYYDTASTQHYELMLRAFKEYLIAHRIPMEYFCNVGGIMRKDDLCSGSYVESVLFISLADDDELEGSKFLESGIYLCMVCHKSECEIEYIEAMQAEIDAQGYKIAGDYICEVVDEFCGPKGRIWTLKLQIPVQFNKPEKPR